MISPVRRDSTSEYSNMSEPGKLEIDTGAAGSMSKTDSAKLDGDNEVSNVCIVDKICFRFLHSSDIMMFFKYLFKP